MPAAKKPPELDRMVPHSVEAEDSVLGSILIDPECLTRLASMLKPDDFYIIRNRWIYEAILGMQKRGAPIDYLTLSAEIEQTGKLADIGGPAYLAHLINVVPTAIHAHGYAEIVIATAMRRSLLSAASDIAQFAYDDETDVSELRARSLARVAETRRHGTRLKSIAAVALAVNEEIESYAANPLQPGEVRGLSTGLKAVNEASGGLDPGLLFVVAGRPGMGKSTLLLQVADAVATTGKRVLFSSMEMTTAQLVFRLIAGRARISTETIRAGRVPDEMWPVIIHHMGIISELPLLIDDTPDPTLADIEALVAEHEPDLLLIDHMRKIADKHENEVLRMGIISNGLKNIARRYDIPVFAAAQLNRNVEHRTDKRPTMADIRDSGRIEEDSDVILGAYWGAYYERDKPADQVGHYELIPIKRREGASWKAELWFEPAFSRLYEYAYGRELAGFQQPRQLHIEMSAGDE